MFEQHELSRDACQLFGNQAKCGYDWWWHSFTGRNEKDGAEKSFFIEFFLCNPALGGAAPVFGQLPGNQEKNVKPSYLMVKAGAWGEDAAQLHRFFGWNEINVSMSVPYSVKAGNCYVDEMQTYGTVELSAAEAANHPEYMCESGSISWNLKMDKKTAFNVGYGAGSIFRKIQLFEMFWHVEGMKTAYSGEVIWNGGSGRGPGRLYRDNKLVDEVIAGNVGCEHGEYDSGLQFSSY